VYAPMAQKAVAEVKEPGEANHNVQPEREERTGPLRQRDELVTR
jgi:hypothetical protein